MAVCNIGSVWAHERALLWPPRKNFSFGSEGFLRPLRGTGIIVEKESSSKSQLCASEGEDPTETSPLSGALHTVAPIDLKVASSSPLEPLWDHLMRRYHYLGYQKLLGHRLKYLAFVQGRAVAALSFSAPALKLRVRDQYIGWSPQQRREHLCRIVNNSRFLILPWVRVKNLASHVLSRALCSLRRDWPARFGEALWMVESFVDPARFKGTCYRAANFQLIGQSAGSGKAGHTYVYHGVIKEVYVYVIEPRFREWIGCERKPYSLFQRPSPSVKKVEDLKMILRHAKWNPEMMPQVKLAESDVCSIAEELVRFHEQFQDSFGRKEQGRLGLAYISGLLSDQAAKSVEPIALHFLDQKGVRPLQQFMKSYRWDHEAVERKHQSLLSELIADPCGMISVDSSEFAKKGKESVGVARQYCGRLGKVDNCQSGVFVGYSSRKGYSLLTARLYMPESWFTEEQAKRRQDTRVPEGLHFQSKPQIAGELIGRIDPLFPAKWIGCDATFGSDWKFLESLPQGKFYFAGIKSSTRVFLKKPLVDLPPYPGRGRPPKKLRVTEGKAHRVAAIARWNRCPWRKVVLAEGAKGPIVAQVAALRVYPAREGLPKPSAVWLFLRRTEDGQIKYALSNAPQDTPVSELCEAATLRWPIEQCFQDGKSQVGMDHYEHRSWPAWHRHMIYVFLALHFLLRLRIRFKKNTCPDASTSADPRSRRAPPQGADARLRAGTGEVSHPEKPYRIPLPQEEAISPADRVD